MPLEGVYEPSPEPWVREQQKDPLPPTTRRLAAGPCRGPENSSARQARSG